MISLSIIGLSIIVIGWIVQFYLMNKTHKISKLFVALYALGVLFLIIDGFASGLNDLATANLISLIVALAVLIKLKYSKSNGNNK